MILWRTWMCFIFTMLLKNSLAFEHAVKISKQDVTVGEVFDLALTLIPHEEEVVIPPGQEFVATPFTLVSHQVNAVEKSNAQTQASINVVYRLAIYQTGDFSIPNILLLVTGKDGVKQTQSVDTKLTVHVKSVLAENDEALRDIRGPAEIPLNPWWIVLWLALGFVFFTLLYVWFKKRKRRTKDISHVTAPRLSPWDEVMERIQQLKQNPSYLEKRSKPYFSDISDILRNYIDRVYSCDACEKTTSEILRHPSLRHLSSEERTDLRQILSRSDEIKFAKLVPLEDEYDEILAKLQVFVDKTSRPLKARATEVKA